DTARQRLRTALEVSLFFSLAAGCHPITALYGLVFMAGLSLTVFARAGRAERPPIGGRLGALLPAALLALLLLAPWAYLCAKFNDKLHVHSFGMMFFKNDIDRWWVRLFPLPLDVRVWRHPQEQVSTPHLDAQISIPLLLLALGVGWGVLRRSVKAGRWLIL